MPPPVRWITISVSEAGISQGDKRGGEGCNRRSFIYTQGFKKQQAGHWLASWGCHCRGCRVIGVNPGAGQDFWRHEEGAPFTECLQCRRPQLDSWVRKLCWRRDSLPTPVFLVFPCDSAGKESTCNVGDLGSIPGLGRSPGEGKGYSLQYPGLENSRDCMVHGVANSRTRLSDLYSHCVPHIVLGFSQLLSLLL